LTGIVGPDGATIVGGAPTEEQIAFAMAKARERMLKESMNAARNQLEHLARTHALPIDVNSTITQAMLAAMAAASVTAAQLLIDQLILSLGNRLQNIINVGVALEKRVVVLEAANAEVGALNAKLADALQRLGTPTPEEFERISREVCGKPGEVAG